MRTKTRLIVGLSLSMALAACGIEAPAPAPEAVNDESGTYEKVEEVEPVDGGEAFEYESAAEADVMGFAPNGAYAPADDFNTEEYDTIEESGFVNVATKPLSTVSADVDTASYANVRRMLMDGYAVQDERGPQTDETEEPVVDSYYYDSNMTIPTGAVRIEEMVNYFDYDYAAPTGDAEFNVVSQIAACPWNEDTKLLSLGFTTAPEDESVSEAGRNLVFLIDISGSMDDPDKLPLLQSAFGELVDQLTAKDTVCILTYAAGAQVILDGASGDEGRAIMRAIRSLEADGSTNGEAGLKMAYDIAQDHFIKGGVNRIIMASDGDLNVGISSESDLHDFVEKKRDTGIYLSVLGFGAGNYKDNKMETLADCGNGSYHYIDCEAEAKRVFRDRICQNLIPFANDTKLQVEFNPAKIKAYRLIGYENRTLADEDFTDDTKDAGEVGPDAQFTVLYELIPAGSDTEVADVPDLKYSSTKGDATTTELLTATVRYKSIAKDEVLEVEHVVDEKDIEKEPNQDFKLAAAVTEFGMILRNSEFKGTSTYDSVRKLVGESDNEQVTEFLELVDLAEKN